MLKSFRGRPDFAWRGQQAASQFHRHLLGSFSHPESNWDQRRQCATNAEAGTVLPTATTLITICLNRPEFTWGYRGGSDLSHRGDGGSCPKRRWSCGDSFRYRSGS